MTHTTTEKKTINQNNYDNQRTIQQRVGKVFST